VKTSLILMSALFAALATFAQAALAQSASGHGHHGAAAAAPAAGAKTEMSEGEVRRLDPQQHKITLKHGPIRNLDMPAMTMVFQATDQARAMLVHMKVGDKVRFTATNPGGQLTVTELQPAR
jgi:Cu(I)/Ag(I) efflux system protein CusF